MFSVLSEFISSASSFILKSTSFADDEAAENRIIAISSNALETASRDFLVIDGGRCVFSVGASIDILYINVKIRAQSFPLPFKVLLDDVEVLFDEIEPSPVF
jgi:hypothetical protein